MFEGYDSNFDTITFDKRPCEKFADFICGEKMYADFFKNQMLANCSAECPAECSSIDYSYTQTFSGFPPPSYMYYLLSKSERLSQKYFNLSSDMFKKALKDANASLVPPMETLKSTLSGKLLSLNIYYDDLVYTKIEESAKMSLIDLIAGMGGTLVKNSLF